ncbi:hexosaminidase D-like isoform X3 [Rhodnius prolixus]
MQNNWKNLAYNESPEKEKAKSAFSGHRIVHLDLKGAPPKVSYYKEFFPFIKTLGATGVLMEYEDMFPYSIDVSAHNAYTAGDIKEILRYANESSLEVIPLIQTFGHLEFVLKLDKFKHLREVFKYPQAICPSNNETHGVLLSMIDDIVQAHEGLRYLHIGCDEVFQLGECRSCREKIIFNEKWNKNKLFLDHLSTVARYVKERYPGVTPLIWDDNLRTLTVSELDEWRLGKLIEPVVWKYTADVEMELSPQMWSTYSVVFPAIWIASSFKGARNPDAVTNQINFYYENHKSWMKLVAKYSDKITFRGVITTGWQRFDHFSVLCELLPVSIPSLAVNLLYLSTELQNLIDISIEAQGACKCDFNLVQASHTDNHEGHCSFPGSKVFDAVNKLPHLLYALQRVKDKSSYRGWFSPYNLKHSFSSPVYVEAATNNLLVLEAKLINLENEIREAMSSVYDKSTADEWIATNIEPTKEELRKDIEGRVNILMVQTWPKRPLPDK